MSELTVTLLRLGYLLVLWLFVISAIGVLRRDLYGTRIIPRSRRTKGAQPAPAASRTAPGGPPASAAPPAPARPELRLVVTAGPLRGTTIPLTSAGVTIGRAPSNTLVLDDEYTSSRHAQLFRQGDIWYVEDLGSTNGTFVDEMRIVEATEVPPGLPVRVGQSTLELGRG